MSYFDIRTCHYLARLTKGCKNESDYLVDSKELRLFRLINVKHGSILRNIAFAHTINHIRHDADYFRSGLIDKNHQRLGQQCINSQNTDVIAPDIVYSLSAPPSLRPVDDVVVDQCGHVNHFGRHSYGNSR